jgi:hypothetical protein
MPSTVHSNMDVSHKGKSYHRKQKPKTASQFICITSCMTPPPLRRLRWLIREGRTQRKRSVGGKAFLASGIAWDPCALWFRWVGSSDPLWADAVSRESGIGCKCGRGKSVHPLSELSGWCTSPMKTIVQIVHVFFCFVNLTKSTKTESQFFHFLSSLTFRTASGGSLWMSIES